MVHKSPPQLLIILLGFSLVISSVAVPASRSLLSNGEEFSRLSTQATPLQGLVDLRTGEETTETGEDQVIVGRMDLESTDYPGTGANNRHDPRTPGRP
ncbi:uncharacterized protein LOC114724615 [Neltuma alba]|uniref:uncharacterized protein LOC114724615 n=1 Tax=Neltuma alba TaxID=207710 RepID=UPI0010A3EF18|nr:uncharacterized protein LOC114724615 [Prosopis alba]XP_028766834.1 uncharacterized protein LOC114724615 [Prosopis alba]